MEILRLIITILFVVVCIALAAIVLLQEGSLPDWVRSAELLKPTGERIKAVPWKEHL